MILNTDQDLAEIVTVQNAVLSPAWGTVKSGDRLLDWSCYNKPDSHLKKFRENNKVGTVRVAKGYIAYNNGYGNQYHLIREWIASIFIFLQLRLEENGYIIILPKLFNKVNYSRNELLNAVICRHNLQASIKFIDVENVDDIAVEHLIYPKVLTGCFYLNKFKSLADFFEDIAINIIGTEILEELRTRMRKRSIGYVSRQDSSKRKVLNERLCEQQLMRLFSANIATFTHKSLRDQILFVNQNAIIVGVHGAGLSNLVFCVQRYNSDVVVERHLIEIMPVNYNHDFYKMISEEKNIKYKKVLAQIVHNDLIAERITYSVIVDEVVTAVRSHFEI